MLCFFKNNCLLKKHRKDKEDLVSLVGLCVCGIVFPLYFFLKYQSGYVGPDSFQRNKVFFLFVGTKYLNLNFNPN